MKKFLFVKMALAALALSFLLSGCSDDDSSIGSILDEIEDTGTTKLATPTNVRYSDGFLSWNPVSGATGYKIYHSYSIDGSYSDYGSVTGTSCSVISSYYVGRYLAVKACGGSGYSDSDLSGFVLVTSLSSATLDAPTGFAYSNGVLSWNPVSGAKRYRIYSYPKSEFVDRAEDDYDFCIAETAGTRFNVHAVYAYSYFKVKAYGDSDDKYSEASEVYQVKGPSPITFSGPLIIDCSSSGWLEWKKNYNATSYYIYRGDTPDEVFDAADVSFVYRANWGATETVVTPGYYYGIKSYNDNDGYSPIGNIVYVSGS